MRPRKDSSTPTLSIFGEAHLPGAAGHVTDLHEHALIGDDHAKCGGIAFDKADQENCGAKQDHGGYYPRSRFVAAWCGDLSG